MEITLGGLHHRHLNAAPSPRIVRSDRQDRLLSPNDPGLASLPGEVLTIACLPVLICLVLAVRSLRTTRGRTALATALAIAGTVAGWHAYHFSIVVPEIRAANR